MNLGQLDIEETGKVFVNKYVQYGNQELTITGFEMKESSTGKHLIKMNVESPTIKEDGFVADESAINGGQVGNIQVGIFADYTNEEKQKEIGKIMQTIAKRASEKYGDNSIYDKVIAAGTQPTMQDYLNEVAKVLRGKFVAFQVCAEAYATKTSDKGKVYDKTFLKLGRYGFVASTVDELKPFDKDNQYHYSYSKDYHTTADTAPMDAGGTSDAGVDPWA